MDFSGSVNSFTAIIMHALGNCYKVRNQPTTLPNVDIYLHISVRPLFDVAFRRLERCNRTTGPCLTRQKKLLSVHKSYTYRMSKCIITQVVRRPMFTAKLNLASAFPLRICRDNSVLVLRLLFFHAPKVSCVSCSYIFLARLSLEACRKVFFRNFLRSLLRLRTISQAGFV